MYFDATDEMKTIQIGLQRDLFADSYVDWGDGTTQELSNTITIYTKE